jgi:DinB superfamily
VPIEPDTKDWTWVLDRPCPECGFDAGAFPRERIGAMLRDNAAGWRAVLSRDEVRERPNDATWSPLEYACHVRDVFRLYDARLRMMLEEDDPLYPNWDQDETAVAERYGEQDPQQVADELDAAADAVAKRFDGVHGEQWNRRGRRSDGASFTVETFGRYFAHDWVHHLWDVTPRP